MAAVYSLLIILTLSMFVTRVATIALSLTGVSHDLARLQSISAFTGVGFTTRESESLVNHPARRRILIALMILGNAGIVTSVSSLILSFTSLETGQWYMRLAVIAVGVFALWLIARSKRLEVAVDAFIRWLLDQTTHLRVLDYVSLLSLGEDYEVRTLRVEPDDWIAGRTLEQARLFQEGIVVLGIHGPDGTYAGVPRGETPIDAGDRLVLYGRSEDLSELDERRRGAGGDAQHERAVEEQRQARDEQRNKDARHPKERDVRTA